MEINICRVLGCFKLLKWPFSFFATCGFLLVVYGCRPVEVNVSPAPPVTPTAAKLGRQNLTVESHHSENARMGDLAGMLVTVGNESGTPVRNVRIRVTSTYFSGLGVRRTQPEAISIGTDGDSRSFLFAGPVSGSSAGYMLVLTPLAEGEFSAEVSVTAVDEATEYLLAIYDIATKIGPDLLP